MIKFKINNTVMEINGNRSSLILVSCLSAGTEVNRGSRGTS